MNDIDTKINLKKKELGYRITQHSSCDKKIKFYYSEQIRLLKEEILDLESLKIFNYNLNENDIIDIHGATKYFVDYYLEDILYYKLELYNKIKLITGKGTFTLFNIVKKFLSNEPNFKYKIDNYCFEVSLHLNSNR